MNAGKPYSAELWRAAIAERQPWLKTTGPRTEAGRRICSDNAATHGADSQTFKLALIYLAGLEEALSK